MTRTKTFIELAKCGGWKAPLIYQIYNYPEILLDPLAWYAVGKVKGWNLQEKQHEDPKGTTGHTRDYLKSGWLFHWHEFVDFLAKGNTVEESLGKVLK